MCICVFVCAPILNKWNYRWKILYSSRVHLIIDKTKNQNKKQYIYMNIYEYKLVNSIWGSIGRKENMVHFMLRIVWIKKSTICYFEFVSHASHLLFFLTTFRYTSWIFFIYFFFWMKLCSSISHSSLHNSVSTFVVLYRRIKKWQCACKLFVLIYQSSNRNNWLFYISAFKKDIFILDGFVLAVKWWHIPSHLNENVYE